jgi:hypothetical protein
MGEPPQANFLKKDRFRLCHFAHIRGEQVVLNKNTTLGREPFSRYKRPTGGNFLPIDPGAIPLTMATAMRVGRNTGGEQDGRATQPATCAEPARDVLLRRY